ncbi:MAG TPA: hypothetical protein VMG60_05005 [Burkholderiaceae bacterium]|nr:hypothetical protein [Burkholderiaceae bacterium]
MDERGARRSDQAAGLRRLFGVARARLAPIPVDPGRTPAQVASIVRLAQACARSGQHTLVLDCTRAQIAASLGLRARFDLLHALRRECSLEQVRLDAGPELSVVPAARAAPRARGAEVQFMTALAALAQGPCAADLVLMVMEPAHAPLLHAMGRGEVVAFVPRQRAAWSGMLRALANLADGPDIAGFRLLFPGWDADTAARLFRELAQACADRLAIELRFGGAARLAPDWLRVARSMSEWELPRLQRPQTTRTF